jgi:membrane protein
MTRSALELSDLRSVNLWLITKRVAGRVSQDRITLISAGVAFYGLLALFPSIAALIAISGLVLDPASVSHTIVPLLAALPDAAAEIVETQITSVVSSRPDTLGLGAVIGLLISLYSASKATGTVMEGLNAVYETNETRDFVTLKLTTLGLTLFHIILLVLAAGLIAVLPAWLGSISETGVAATIADVLRWPIAWLLAIGSLAVLYRFAPALDGPEWRWVTIGSVFTSVVGMLGTFGFSFYVANFGRYNETFGALAGFILLLTWLWLISIIVLVGALINAELERDLKGTLGHTAKTETRAT